ncbi:MAG TPA: hypothetical protein VJ924_12740, partial [Alphaproteobacteria bacterium]|nr:hypothetical protein [Alphaproteobacteria bacterium]
MEPVYCACGAELNEPSDTPVAKRQPYTECGSTANVRRIHLFCTHANKVYELIKARHYAPGIEGWVTERITGWDIRRSVGDWVRKFRLIDKKQDRYVERITTADGQIVHDDDERLSEHVGHGSA